MLAVSGCADPVCPDPVGREIPEEALRIDTLDGVVSYSPAGASLPWQVSPLGDVNGDGIADLAVWTSDLADEASIIRTYIIFGGPDLVSGDLDTAVANGRGFVIEGGETYDAAQPATPVGDINGDGRDDIGLGGTLDPLLSEGYGYVVFGRGGDGIVGLEGMIDDGTGIVIAGESPTGRLADSIAGMGDVDEDGFDDFLVLSVTGDLDAADPAGWAPTDFSVHLIHGRGAAWIDLATDPDSRVVLRSDEGEDPRVTVIGTADLDGDGRRDLAIGDPLGADSRGRLVLVSASVFDLGEPPTMTEAVAAGFASMIEGLENGDGLGSSPADVGDLNDDGLHEVAIVGSGAGDRRGEVVVVFGSASVWDLTRAAVDVGGGIVVAGNAMDRLERVAGGDADGDGLPDLFVGSSSGSLGLQGSGVGYILHGAAGWDDRTLAPGGPGLTTIAGPQKCGGWGGPWGFVGDTTGDGMDEIVLVSTATGDVTGLPPDSRVYLIKGRTTW